MEFAAGIDSNGNFDIGSCYICKKKTWIYFIEKEQPTMAKKHVCELHFIELIKIYLRGELSNTIDLFPQELDILNLPIQKIAITSGTTTFNAALLNNSLMQINQKLERIDKEIAQNTANGDKFFLAILEKERTESDLMKHLMLAYKKSQNL